ncbi:amidohydrolase family protein [Niallia oryzisoli]|uniref:2-amino-3-carboxymuconate-6-semialdehyde decarboxylase n=1 Tax=Niallia oryzisoli TaxID=1737571 RepID=A0ABZ2CBW7_9BACI
MIIDIHTHFVPETLPYMSNRVGGEKWPAIQCVCGQPNHRHVMISGKNYRTITNQSWSPERRIADMVEENVDIQVISPMPQLLSYWFNAQDTLDFSRYINEQLAIVIAEDPKRFYGLGMVPLQDPELAAKELGSLKRNYGMVGVEVGTNINGKSIGDPFFDPFFAEAEAQGMVIFIHAIHPQGKERFIGAPLVNNLVGFPTENGLAISSLITSGLLEKYPNLKIVSSHGGGSFSSILPRLNQGWNINHPFREFCPHPPTYYAQKIYYDTLVYDVKTIKYLIDLYGPTQLIVGSDYPYIIREENPGHWLNNLEVTQEIKDQIMYKNALRLLDISI